MASFVCTASLSACALPKTGERPDESANAIVLANSAIEQFTTHLPTTPMQHSTGIRHRAYVIPMAGDGGKAGPRSPIPLPRFSRIPAIHSANAQGDSVRPFDRTQPAVVQVPNQAPASPQPPAGDGRKDAPDPTSKQTPCRQRSFVCIRVTAIQRQPNSSSAIAGSIWHNASSEPAN